MKRLLLTGGAGFIGHHFVEHVLRNTDWKITIIDRLSYAGDLNRLSDIEIWAKEGRRVNFVYHDFRAAFHNGVVERVARLGCNYIVHMGAETHVDNSITDPRPFVESNVMGTLSVLELALKLEPEKFIYVSTDEVYGPVLVTNGAPVRLHKEGEPHRPSNPYSASKSGAEALCYSFWNTYSLPIIITNTMNNFGERQSTEKFIPKTLLSLLRKQPCVIHVRKENGKIVDVSSRCWLHARNHADALVFLLRSGKAKDGERYNVVGEWANVETIVDMVADAMNITDVQKRYEDYHAFRPGHDMHYGLDGSKMKQIGWQQPLNLHSSLAKTVSWTMTNRHWLC